MQLQAPSACSWTCGQSPRPVQNECHCHNRRPLCPREGMPMFPQPRPHDCVPHAVNDRQGSCHWHGRCPLERGKASRPARAERRRVPRTRDLQMCLLRPPLPGAPVGVATGRRADPLQQKYHHDRAVRCTRTAYAKGPQTYSWKGKAPSGRWCIDCSARTRVRA